MRKYIDKINSYIESNKGTKKGKSLQFFAPLLLLLIIKVVIFLDCFLLPSRGSFCAFLLLYCATLFIVIVLLSIYRFIEKMLCLNKIEIPLKILLLSPFLLFTFLSWLVETYGKDFGLLEFVIVLEIIAYIFFLWFPFFIYFQIKKNQFLLFNSLTDLKQSLIGLILCILFDIGTFFYTEVLRNSEALEVYLWYFSSVFYLIFFLLNLVSCLKSKLKKSNSNLE